MTYSIKFSCYDPLTSKRSEIVERREYPTRTGKEDKFKEAYRDGKNIQLGLETGFNRDRVHKDFVEVRIPAIQREA